MLALGAVLVTSASLEIASVRYGGANAFSLRHGIYVVVSMLAFLVVLSLPVAHWQRLGPLAYLASVVLLLAVLLVGREVNGSLRWIGVGPLTIQPSELAKFLLLIYLAHSLTRHQAAVRGSFWGMVRPIAWLLGPMALILAEPDLGSVVVILAAAGSLVTPRVPAFEIFPSSSFWPALVAPLRSCSSPIAWPAFRPSLTRGRTNSAPGTS